MALLERLADGTAVFGVVGLGYVGLPLVVEMALEGHHVIGIDISEGKVAEVSAGRSYIPDVPTADLAALVSAGRSRPRPTSLARVSAMSWSSACRRRSIR